MDFALLILVTAILLIRPTDFVPVLASVPLYEVAILSCFAASWNKVHREFTAACSGARPITAYMFGILAFGLIANLANGDAEGGLNFVVDFAKVITYFLLLTAVVDTPGRLRSFLLSIVLITLTPASLALLHHHRFIQLPVFEVMMSGDVERLIGSGMFADPNDFCEVLNLGLIFSLFGLLANRLGFLRIGWIVPIFVFAVALQETKSRGGFLGTLAGTSVLILTKYGLRKAILIAAVSLPALFFVFAGRNTSIDLKEGTGQSRIQIWADGFALLVHSPIFGIGAEHYTDAVGKATHNAFICAYTELGVIGGSFFFGACCYSLTTLQRIGSSKTVNRDPALQRTRPFVFAALVSYLVSEMSLTHPYNVLTYMMLGLAASFIRQADPEMRLANSRLDGRSMLRMLTASACFLVGLFFFVQLSVRF